MKVKRWESLINQKSLRTRKRKGFNRIAKKMAIYTHGKKNIKK